MHFSEYIKKVKPKNSYFDIYYEYKWFYELLCLTFGTNLEGLAYIIEVNCIRMFVCRSKRIHVNNLE